MAGGGAPAVAANRVDSPLREALARVDDRCVSSTSETAPSAVALLGAAFAHRYRYRSGFPGWRATAVLQREAPRSALRAHVEVTGPGQVQVDPIDAISVHDAEWLLQEVRAMSRTLYGHDFEVGEGRFAMSLDSSPHVLGPLIVLHDDPHDATFRVRRHRVTLATRRNGSLHETVRVDRWHVRPDGRWLPAQWTADVRSAQLERPLRTDRYWDVFWPLGGVVVPQLRRVETVDDLGIKLVHAVHLRDWRLLA